jgi:hypothetical protein
LQVLSDANRSLLGLTSLPHARFIERYFGFSPDHGDGSFEVMLLVVAVLLTMVFAMSKRGINLILANHRALKSFIACSRLAEYPRL